MAYTTAAEVKEILTTSLSDAAVEAYIAVATDMIADLTTTNLDTTRLELIERWLTAHLIAVTKERQTQEEEVGEARAKYTGKFGMNLQSTTYGQTASMLDTTGALAELGKKKIMIRAITSFDT